MSWLGVEEHLNCYPKLTIHLATGAHRSVFPTRRGDTIYIVYRDVLMLSGQRRLEGLDQMLLLWSVTQVYALKFGFCNAVQLKQLPKLNRRRSMRRPHCRPVLTGCTKIPAYPGMIFCCEIASAIPLSIDRSVKNAVAVITGSPIPLPRELLPLAKMAVLHKPIITTPSDA